MLCQKPQADHRAFLTSATSYVFSMFLYDAVICEGYITCETLVTW